MYYVKFREGIKQPRVLGGYSDLGKAQERVADHRNDRGLAETQFIEEEDQWRVMGPDEEYTIWSSQ